MLKPITLNRYVFHSLRKLLSTWVSTTVENYSADALQLKPGKPVVYVLHQRFADRPYGSGERVHRSRSAPTLLRTG